MNKYAFLDGYLSKRAEDEKPAKMVSPSRDTPIGRLLGDVEDASAEATAADEAATHKRNALTGKLPRGYDPKTQMLDMSENLIDIYGKHRDREFNKADTYSKEKGLPMQMGKGYRRPIPLKSGRDAQLEIPPSGRARINIPKDLSKLSKFLKKHEDIDIPSNTDPKTTNEVLRHEMSHAATLLQPGLTGKADRKANSPYKALRRASEFRIPGFSPGSISTLRREGTYPERVGAENIPPMAGLQQHLFKTTGKRIETPEQYDAWIKQAEKYTPEQRAKLPLEVQRLLNYRDKMREGQGKLLEGEDTYNRWQKQRLMRYDNNNRTFLPGVVKNQRPSNRGRV